MRLPASTFSLSGTPDSCNHSNLQCMIMASVAKALNTALSNMSNEETLLELQAGLLYTTSNIVSDSYQILH